MSTSVEEISAVATYMQAVIILKDHTIVLVTKDMKAMDFTAAISAVATYMQAVMILKDLTIVFVTKDMRATEPTAQVTILSLSLLLSFV